MNQKTWERETIKVGIAGGKDWRHVIKEGVALQTTKSEYKEHGAGRFTTAGDGNRNFTRSIRWTDTRQHMFGGHVVL